jgi:pectate lyase
MKLRRRILAWLSIIPLLATSASSAVYLSDTWADGSRTNQNLPAESAWFSSNGSALTAATNSMNLALGNNAVMGITYFTTNDSNPVQLGVGDTLNATFKMKLTDVAPPNTSLGFRIALANLADSALSPKRVNADGFSSSSQGSGVQSYALFQNMGTSFNLAGTMSLRKRTTLSDNSLLGTTGDWTTIGAGPVSSNNFPGFTAGVQYNLQLSLQRTAANTIIVSASWLNTATGGFISAGFFDFTATNFNFDGIAFRPQQASQAASNITFVLVKVETTSSPVPPAITTQPTNQIVTEGESTTFSVVASGTAPFAYQWYFNTNTALPDATNASLTISNAQFSDAGAYSVIVTNAYGAETSSVVTLTVNPAAVPPSIIAQPEDQNVLVGQGAAFSVTATGSAPLNYQWYFNTNTALANATNDVLAFPNAQSSDAGAYFVIVTNAYGAVTSDVATLTVNLPSGTLPNFDLVGFATLDGFNSFGYNQQKGGGVTGGGGGMHVQVWTVTNLVSNLQSNATLMVEIMTNLDLSVLANNSGGFPAGYPTGEILVRSNKTIYSQNGSTISRGTLRLGKPSLGPQGNVIIRNLKFRDLWVFDPTGNYDTYGWDYVHLEEGSHHVWVDHCDFQQVYDGMIDLSHGSDFLTASWNVFRYQKKCCLIGSSDNNQSEDTNHFNVTFHHNYFVNVAERTPRMRFGNAHVFNIYVDNLGAYTPTNNQPGAKAIQSTAGAATLVENSYFYHPQIGTFPTIEANGGPTGTVKVVNSTIENLPGVNVTFRQFGEATFAFNYPFATNQPPYPYTLDEPSDVPYQVTNYAGVGKLAPVIIAQPQNQSVVSGQTASFNVVVIGDSPITYRWYFNTNTSLVSATNATLTISNVQSANVGTYTVVVSNLFGSATSSVAVLTIGQASVSVVGTPELTNGVFHVLFIGTPNQAYVVDRATEVLGPWEFGYTNLISEPDGLFDLFDAANPFLSERYYRVRYP